MEWGLGRLADSLGDYEHQALDFLSCTTLDVENCHAAVHSKKMNMSKLENARSFIATMKGGGGSNVLQAGLLTTTPVEGPGTQSPIQWCLLVTYR